MEEAEGVLERVFKEGRPVRTMARMRLAVSPAPGGGGGRGELTAGPMTALNEVNVHRGSQPSLARIECAVEGTRLTSAIADGYAPVRRGCSGTHDTVYRT